MSVWSSLYLLSYFINLYLLHGTFITVHIYPNTDNPRGKLLLDRKPRRSKCIEERFPATWSDDLQWLLAGMDAISRGWGERVHIGEGLCHWITTGC